MRDKDIERQIAHIVRSKDLFHKAKDEGDPIIDMLSGMVQCSEDMQTAMGASTAAVIHLNDRINKLEQIINNLAALISEN
jgi:hypothetical protein